MYVCMYMCMYVYIYIYIYREREREREIKITKPGVSCRMKKMGLWFECLR